MGLTPVAIVGAGRMAREHARAFADVPGVVLAGIASRTRSHAEELAGEAGIARVAGDVADLYAATEARLVVVAVVETAMREVALACLEHPWTVLLEKPPGLSPAETAVILAAARERGRDVRVGLNRQYLGATQHVLADLASHPGPRFVKVQDQQNLAQAAALGHAPAVVEGWMYANSIHLVDYFRVLARGVPVGVEVVMPWDPARPAVLVARISFDSGDVGLYEAIWHGPGPWAATVTVDGARWELRPLEQATRQRLGERPELLPAQDVDARFKPGFRLQAERVVAAARGEASDAPALAEAAGTMKLIEALYGR